MSVIQPVGRYQILIKFCGAEFAQFSLGQSILLHRKTSPKAWHLVAGENFGFQEASLT